MVLMSEQTGSHSREIGTLNRKLDGNSMAENYSD